MHQEHEKEKERELIVSVIDDGEEVCRASYLAGDCCARRLNDALDSPVAAIADRPAVWDGASQGTPRHQAARAAAPAGAEAHGGEVRGRDRFHGVADDCAAGESGDGLHPHLLATVD